MMSDPREDPLVDSSFGDGGDEPAARHPDHRVD